MEWDHQKLPFQVQKRVRRFLRFDFRKKSTNTKSVGIEVMKPSYLMELFCYFTFLGYRETFLDLKRLFLMIPLYFLFRALINTIIYVRRPNLELCACNFLWSGLVVTFLAFMDLFCQTKGAAWIFRSKES